MSMHDFIFGITYEVGPHMKLFYIALVATDPSRTDLRVVVTDVAVIFSGGDGAGGVHSITPRH